jgi:hypothetical protein
VPGGENSNRLVFVHTHQPFPQILRLLGSAQATRGPPCLPGLCPDYCPVSTLSAEAALTSMSAGG